MNIDVNHNLHSNNCNSLFLGCFLAENTLTIDLKIYFPRWHVRELWITTRDESFHSDVFSEINFMYWTKESGNNDAECIFCNGKFSEDERGKI